MKLRCWGEPKKSGMSLRRRKCSAILKRESNGNKGEKTNERHLDNRISTIHKHIPSHTPSSVRQSVSKCSDPSKRMWLRNSEKTRLQISIYHMNQPLHTRLYCSVTHVTVTVQSFSCVRLFATSWTAACQASLSFTISRSLLRFISVELVRLFNHLILYHPLLLLPWPGYRSLI